MMNNKDIAFAYQMLDEFDLAALNNGYILDETTDNILSFYNKKLVLKRDENFKCDYGETEFNPLRNGKLMNMLISRYSNILYSEGTYIKTFYPEYEEEIAKGTSTKKRYVMILNEDTQISSDYYYNDNICLAQLISYINGNLRDFSQFEEGNEGDKK